MTTYPAITIWQPWATLIAEGFKPYEFRSWPAPRAFWGQRIAIHAGARPVKRDEVADLLLRLANPRASYSTGLVRLSHVIALLDRIITAPRSMPLSSVLCLATMGEPVDGKKLAAAIGAPVNDSDRNEHSIWGWPLTDIERLEPFLPATGRQGFWQWESKP